MDILTLALLTALCGAGAIWFWLGNAKLQSEIDGLRSRADKADAEAAKAADRAEALKKKLEGSRTETAKEDKGLKEVKAQLADAKDQAKRAQAAAKKAEQLAEETALKLRKAEAHNEELAAMAHLKPKKPVVVEAAPVVVDAPPPVPEDPKLALRRAEIEAEREQHRLEAEKLRLERETVRAQMQAESERDQIDRLRTERERLARMVFERELDLRVALRKAEDNRRAYMMTMGALDLAEDELYRLKHGRERPEFDPGRAAAIARPHGVEAAEPTPAETEEGPADGEVAEVAAVPVDAPPVEAAVAG